MKLFRWHRLTDAEFVEKTRKQNQSARRRAWFLLSFAIFYLGLCAACFWQAATNNYSQMGFWAGCFIGVFAGVFLIKALMYFAFFMNHLFGRRQEQLLVKFYDQLHLQGK
ncbi:MAG TPA: hypothetical protein VK742_12215 [Candidatus Sulfotelmatobacter sp.]|jgi:hypothetical protein|nr:hypothetical protein [Candidatus Sulfotelmatobacter sp.]